jgi:hypothetical protein
MVAVKVSLVYLALRYLLRDLVDFLLPSECLPEGSLLADFILLLLALPPRELFEFYRDGLVVFAVVLLFFGLIDNELRL